MCAMTWSWKSIAVTGASRPMTSTERGCAMMARAVSASCAWLLCGTLGPATPADAHHTKPHQEAVQAARSALCDRKDPGLPLRHLEGMCAGPRPDSATPSPVGLAH